MGGERGTQAGLAGVKAFIVFLVPLLVPVLASEDFRAALDTLLGPVWTPVLVALAGAILAAIAKAIGGATWQAPDLPDLPPPDSRGRTTANAVAAKRPNILAL